MGRAKSRVVVVLQQESGRHTLSPPTSTGNMPSTRLPCGTPPAHGRHAVAVQVYVQQSHALPGEHRRHRQIHRHRVLPTPPLPDITTILRRIRFRRAFNLCRPGGRRCAEPHAILRRRRPRHNFHTDRETVRLFLLASFILSNTNVGRARNQFNLTKARRPQSFPFCAPPGCRPPILVIGLAKRWEGQASACSRTSDARPSRYSARELETNS